MWQQWAKLLGALGFGRIAADQGHTVFGMRVDHSVANPSRPAPRPGRGGAHRLRGTRWLQ